MRDKETDTFLRQHGPVWLAPDMKRKSSQDRPLILLKWAQRVSQALVLKEPVSEGHCVESFAGVFWTMIYRHWARFDGIPHEEYSALFEFLRSKHDPALMPKAGRALYESLPDEIAVYRGGDDPYVHRGLSWTLDYTVAKTFAQAYGYAIMTHEYPVILSGIVKKSDVAFATNERRESEIVVFSPECVKSRGTHYPFEARHRAAA